MHKLKPSGSVPTEAIATHSQHYEYVLIVCHTHLCSLDQEIAAIRCKIHAQHHH